MPPLEPVAANRAVRCVHAGSVVHTAGATPTP
jgi:hypothetical protein